MRSSVRLALVVMAVCLGICYAAESDCVAQVEPPSGGGSGVAEFQDQLQAGLKARLPGEFEFIALVVNRVETKQLSVGEVKSVFQWSRRKNPKIPFPYFERAMRIIAAQKNVEL